MPEQSEQRIPRASGNAASSTVGLLGQSWREIFRNSILDPVFIALTALTIPLAVWGVLRTASDPTDHGALTSFLLLCTPIIPIIWSVLQPLWSENADVAIMVALTRTGVMPFLVAWPPTIAVAVTVHLPAVAGQIVGTREADGWRYFFGEEAGSLLVQSLGLTGIMGVALPMLAGLVLCVFVVLPVLAWWQPTAAAKSNMLRTDTKADRAAAKVSIRALSIFLMVTFAAPTLIIFGKEEASATSLIRAFANLPKFFVDPAFYFGDLMWAIGVVLIPVGALVILRLFKVQRPDIEKRARFGVNSAEDRKSHLNSQCKGDGDPSALGRTPDDRASDEPQ